MCGRLAYDNWLVVNALLSSIPVLDATRTVIALHQTDSAGTHEGDHAKVGKDINKSAIEDCELAKIALYVILMSATSCLK